MTEFMHVVKWTRARACFFLAIMVQYASSTEGNNETSAMPDHTMTHPSTTDHHHMTTEHGTEPPSSAEVNNYWTLGSLYFNKPQKLSSMYLSLLNFLDSWNEKVYADRLHVHSCFCAVLLCKSVKSYGFALLKIFLSHCLLTNRRGQGHLTPKFLSVKINSSIAVKAIQIWHACYGDGADMALKNSKMGVARFCFI